MGSKVTGSVLIAKRGREEYLSSCIHYLDNANSSNQFDVQVLIVDDGGDKPLDLFAKNLSIKHVQVCSIFQHFNKAYLLNVGMKYADTDFVSVVDIDMVYSPLFFEQMYRKRSGTPYIISIGHKLDDHSSSIVMQTQPKFSEIFSLVPIQSFPEAPSQITLARNTVDKFAEIFESDFFCEDFEGWGGEDSDISFKATELAKFRLIDKYVIPDMWFHLWHENSRDETQFGRNLSLFEDRKGKTKSLVNTYARNFRNYTNH